MIKEVFKKLNYAAILSSPVFWGGIGIIVLLFIIGFWLDSCRTNRTEKKKSELNTNIKTSEIEANILVNQKSNINGEIKNANKNSNAALNNLDNSVRRDSGDFTGNAGDKFCERFPDDSSCAGRRER